MQENIFVTAAALLWVLFFVPLFQLYEQLNTKLAKKKFAVYICKICKKMSVLKNKRAASSQIRKWNTSKNWLIQWVTTDNELKWSIFVTVSYKKSTNFLFKKDCSAHNLKWVTYVNRYELNMKWKEERDE